MTSCPHTVCIYPSIIARACSAVDEAPVFRSMPDGYFRVIIRIIKKINLKRPANAIMASRGTLSKESGKSVETVGRAIKWLETEGLVSRTQKACPGVRGSESPIHPTHRLIEALLLDQPLLVAPERQLAVSGDVSISENPQQSEEKQSPKGKFVHLGGFWIPQELAWMVTRNGVAAGAVLFLMKKAKDQAKRLSDVVAVAAEYLRDKKGKALVGYILRLLGTDRDFGYIAKRNREEEDERQLKDRLARKAVELKGRWLMNQARSVTIFVEDKGLLREWRTSECTVSTIGKAFLEALDDGRFGSSNATK